MTILAHDPHVDTVISTTARLTDKSGIQLPRSQPGPLPSEHCYWRELADARDWEGALVVYLRERWRQAVPLWTVINEVAAEAQPKNRQELRALKKEILASVRDLVRSRRVLRWNRSNLAILDTGQPTVTVEELASLRQQQGRRVQ